MIDPKRQTWNWCETDIAGFNLPYKKNKVTRSWFSVFSMENYSTKRQGNWYYSEEYITEYNIIYVYQIRDGCRPVTYQQCYSTKWDGC